MKITSKDNLKVKEALSYKEGKGEYFLSEGFHLAKMAIETKQAITIFSLKPYPCNCLNIETNEAIIKKLSSSLNPEGIVTVSKKKEPQPVSSRKVLYLDEVSDPGNLGTLLRTALAFSYTDVILHKGANPYKAKVVSSSQGAIYKLNIIFDDNLSLLDELKKQGYTIIGTSLKETNYLKDFTSPKQFVLVLGNEARGVSNEVLSKCDKNLKIEIQDIDSLNVAISGAILMYEL